MPHRNKTFFLWRISWEYFPNCLCWICLRTHQHMNAILLFQAHPIHGNYYIKKCKAATLFSLSLFLSDDVGVSVFITNNFRHENSHQKIILRKMHILFHLIKYLFCSAVRMHRAIYYFGSCIRHTIGIHFTHRDFILIIWYFCTA